jgi:hypothetical protein
VATESPPGNGVQTTLASPYITTTGQTTCVLTSATAFTNAQYHCLITDGSNFEIVMATGLSGTTLTIVRGAESWNGASTSYTFGAGATITVVDSVRSGLGQAAAAQGLAVVTTTNASWPVPAWANYLQILCIGGGGGGGGGGSSQVTTPVAQAGGGGGAAGMWVAGIFAVGIFAVGSNTTLNVTVGTGGAGGTGGAAGSGATGNTGVHGVQGVETSVAATGIAIQAYGGSYGNNSGASTTTVGAGGSYAANAGTGGTLGAGFGAPGAAQADYMSGWAAGGGAGGGAASATAAKGGGGGGAGIYGQAQPGATGGATAGAGTVGASGTLYGAGGGGGGGGSGFTAGAEGGQGGSGGPGLVIITVVG